MSREAVETMFKERLVIPPDGASEDEIFQALREHAAGARARCVARDPAFAKEHPLDEEYGRAVAHRIASMERVDDLERDLLMRGELVHQPTEHLFLPGLYVRRVLNPAGSLVTTMLHKTEHPFFVLAGHILVKDVGSGEVKELMRGDSGVTRPGTRRIILALEDTVFVTVHANPDDCQDLKVLEERYIERREIEDGKTAHELFEERYQIQEEARHAYLK